MRAWWVPLNRDGYEVLIRDVIGAFYEVHRHLGYGLFESLYARALEFELTEQGHQVEREVWVPVYYKRRELGKQRLDMIIDGVLVVEIKATQDLPKPAMRQVYSYIKSTKLELGLLLQLRPRAPFLPSADPPHGVMPVEAP